MDEANSVAVFPVEPVNMFANEAQAIGMLMADAYAAESRARVLGPERSAAQLATAGSMSAAAQQLGAGQYIWVSAVRLESTIAIRAVLYDANGTVVFQARLNATGLDDAQPVCQRLAGALYRRVTPEETRDLRNVTRNEGKAANRMFAEKVVGPKVAFTYPFTIGTNPQWEPLVSVQFDMRMEGQDYFFEWGAGFAIPTNMWDDNYDDYSCCGEAPPDTRSDGNTTHSYGGVFAEVGASFYLNDGNLAPYIGGGLIPRLYGTTARNNEGVGGLVAAYGQFGLMIARQSSSRFYTELRLAQNLMPLPTIDEDRVYPTELTLGVGVGW
jgi:hypothetical protein